MADEAERVRRAEELKNAKEAFAKIEKKTNQHVIEGQKGVELSLSEAELPPFPAIHIRNCEGCTFSVPSNTTVVKLLVEGCQACKISMEQVNLLTGTIEVWRCEGCSLSVDCEVGTLQVDLCQGLEVSYGGKHQMGSLVQAGMHNLNVKFRDQSLGTFETGLEQLRAANPTDTINDDTDQYISRIVNGSLLTERIVRLANDYPTTAREKNEFDEQSKKKSEAIEKMARDMLNIKSEDLSEADKQRLLAATSQQVEDGQSSDEARAKFKKDQGNASFKAQDFTQAAVFYTESILLNDKDHTVYSNRAACFLKLGQAQKALQDADKCVALNPEFVKGHFRRGVALIALEKYEEGAKALSHTLELDPKNSEAKASLQVAQMKAARARQQS